MCLHEVDCNHSYGLNAKHGFSKPCNPSYMKETLAEKIKRLRALSGMTQDQVGKAVGVSRVAVSKWESGDTHNLKNENLVALARTFSTTVGDLLDEKEKLGDREIICFSRAAPLPETDDAHAETPADDKFSFIPQLDIAAACGEGRFVDHIVVKGELAFKKSILRDLGVNESAARVIYAAGGSMWPSIQDGCLVLINTADVEPKDGKVYAICGPDGEILLKRLVRDYIQAMGRQAWIMRSDNPDKTSHPDKVLPPDDRTMIIGRAVWNDNRL